MMMGYGAAAATLCIVLRVAGRSILVGVSLPKAKYTLRNNPKEFVVNLSRLDLGLEHNMLGAERLLRLLNG